MREINFIQNLPNFRKKVKRFKKDKEATIIGKEELGELQMKFKGITGALLKLVQDHMDHKVH